MSAPRVSDLESRFGGDSGLAPGSTNDPAAPWNEPAPDDEEETPRRWPFGSAPDDEEESGEIFLL